MAETATLIKCPHRCREGFHHSSGDGWDEWDECRCCNPKGGNETGMVSQQRVAEYLAAEAAEVARIDAMIEKWQRELCAKCERTNADCRCSGWPALGADASTEGGVE